MGGKLQVHHKIDQQVNERKMISYTRVFFPHLLFSLVFSLVFSLLFSLRLLHLVSVSEEGISRKTIPGKERILTQVRKYSSLFFSSTESVCLLTSHESVVRAEVILV